MNTLSSILKFIGNKFSIEEEPFSITRTAGATIDTAETKFYRQGNVIQAMIVINPITGIAAGGNIFTGVMETAKLRPVSAASLVCFLGQRALVCSLNAAGNITIRNTSASQLDMAGKAYLTGVYLIN